ncbi:UbiD family decarboxylase [Natronocella acetinitrilica]|uniref:UbiD family decarboxylase n=1 Tax=Natronocella acetinitrilica TaxID=414046 RepID=A0AAE3G825_9GAMM|nr:UbiD family decarboxylase [Natronocella acetinitrilica]MCP1676739.1 UbiD family decarboxylase [Natronocella acetinitrilica]
MSGQALRDFLSMVQRDYPEHFLRVTTPIDRSFESTAIVAELERAGQHPVIVFENVKGFSMPLVTNVAANRKLLAAILDVDPANLATSFRDRCQNYLPAEVVGDAPWQDVVLEGDDIDLTKLPIPIQFPVDAAPYITAGQICARDPETGVDTTGFHRLMLKGKNRLGVSLHSRRRMYEFHRRAEERGEPLPAAITLGIHPLHYMGSMAFHYPPGVRKFEIIGALFGESYRLGRTGTDGLEVPWGAEIVIEGHILNDVREPEGPFGEFTGYASYRSTQNVFVAHRVQMRSDAMLHSVVSGMAADHIRISCISREAEILNSLRRNLPNVRAVHVPAETCGALMAIVQMKKTAAGQPQQAIMAAFGTETYCKCVIVVDDDVDIFNLTDVMWAVATRARADRDLFLIPGAMGAILDPASDPEDNTVTKVGVDATKPSGRDYAERLVIDDEQRARAREILAGMGIAGMQ